MTQPENPDSPGADQPQKPAYNFAQDSLPLLVDQPERLRKLLAECQRLETELTAIISRLKLD